ncbi:MAG: V-type ATP synthase subunit F [Lachnospiraceae bacterium]|nr:V-type ATP synthase subunit F [Lachnospiraceae bacterium]
MYKIAVMGDWDSIYGFSALGLDTFRVENNDAEQAAALLKKISSNEYEVIYITEALAAVIPEEIEKYRVLPRPAIILIPGISGNTGEGLAAVKKSVEQAVGSDIIFGNN